jgi:hypothetical protein
MQRPRAPGFLAGRLGSGPRIVHCMDVVTSLSIGVFCGGMEEAEPTGGKGLPSRVLGPG